MIISTALDIRHGCSSLKFLALHFKITKFSTKYRLDYAFLHLKNVKSKNELSIQSVSPF